MVREDFTEEENDWVDTNFKQTEYSIRFYWSGYNKRYMHWFILDSDKTELVSTLILNYSDRIRICMDSEIVVSIGFIHINGAKYISSRCEYSGMTYNFLDNETAKISGIIKTNNLNQFKEQFPNWRELIRIYD